MAHECPDCWMVCHCRGDIDDICFGEWSGCEHCLDAKEYDEYEDEDDGEIEERG